MAVCPKCDIHSSLFRCDACGDVRCNSATTSGSKKGCSVQGKGAVHGGPCRACGKGKYKPV